jgi:hypothetical protein
LVLPSAGGIGGLQKVQKRHGVWHTFFKAQLLQVQPLLCVPVALMLPEFQWPRSLVCQRIFRSWWYQWRTPKKNTQVSLHNGSPKKLSLVVELPLVPLSLMVELSLVELSLVPLHNGSRKRVAKKNGLHQ